MKVKELITELQKHDHEAEVVVDGYELGVNDVRKVVAATVFKNEKRPYWYGRYEMTEPGMYSVKGAQPVSAVYLPRIDDEEAINE
jgi:hypothetical protein